MLVEESVWLIHMTVNVARPKGRSLNHVGFSKELTDSCGMPSMSTHAECIWAAQVTLMGYDVLFVMRHLIRVVPPSTHAPVLRSAEQAHASDIRALTPCQ